MITSLLKTSHRSIYVSYGFIFLFTILAALAATLHWYLAIPWLICALSEWIIQKENKISTARGWLIAGFLDSESKWMAACPPGELADKASILAIKLRKLEGKLTEERERWLQSQLVATLACFHRCINVLLPEVKSKQTKLDLLLDELTQINEEQWNWEDKVRVDQSAEAALGARECNTRRVQCKNKINRLCGVGDEEKSYASKD